MSHQEPDNMSDHDFEGLKEFLAPTTQTNFDSLDRTGTPSDSGSAGDTDAEMVINLPINGTEQLPSTQHSSITLSNDSQIAGLESWHSNPEIPEDRDTHMHEVEDIRNTQSIGDTPSKQGEDSHQNADLMAVSHTLPNGQAATGRRRRRNDSSLSGDIGKRQEELARRAIGQLNPLRANQKEKSGILAGASSILGGLKLPNGGQSRKQVEELARNFNADENGSKIMKSVSRPAREEEDWMDVDSFDEAEDDNQTHERIKQLEALKIQSMEDIVELERLKGQVKMKARRMGVDESSESEASNTNGLFLPESKNMNRHRQRVSEGAGSEEIDVLDKSQKEMQNKPLNQIEESEEEVEERLRREYDETVVAEKEVYTSQSSSDERFFDEERREKTLREAAMNDVAGSGKKRKRTATTGRTPRPKNAREAHENKNRKLLEQAAVHADTSDSPSERAIPAPSKRGRNTKKGAENSATNGEDKGQSKAKAPAKPRKGRVLKITHNIEAEQEEYADMFLKLMNDDAIADRAGHGEVGPAPTFNERENKGRAIKELMASVPKEFKRLVTNDKKVLLKASKMFGHGKVKLVEGKWQLKGMKFPMFHHQLLGVDWMVARECGSARPFGGLLADTMGLGKTMQILATIVGNPPMPRDAGIGTTLIVMPSTIIEQWKTEIERFLPDSISSPVLHYKSKAGMKSDMIRYAKIVLTSYREVCASYPYPDTDMLKRFSRVEIRQWIEENFENEKGVLHQIDFYRVVLDEAHAIKNFKSRTSLACQSLKSKYRWAVTATPIMNKIEEFFPYFRFLRMEESQDIKMFRKRFCNSKDPECAQRVNAFISFVMIRRTHKDKMFNRPIVDIPVPETRLDRIDFSPAERVLYDILESRCRQLMNQHFEAGDPRRSYAFGMVLVLRLRQCTTHPMMLRKTIKDIFTLEDLQLLERRIESIPENQQTYKVFQDWVREANKSIDDDIDGEEGENNDPNRIKLGKAFGKSAFGTTTRYPFGKYLETLDQDTLLGRSICLHCAEIADRAQITSCDHVFCRECLESLLNEQAAINDTDYMQCPSCNSLLSGITPHRSLEVDSNSSTAGSGSSSEDETVMRTKRGRRKMVKNDPWLAIRGDLLPSAKTVAMKDAVLRMLANDPTDKIVIYTQFLLVVKIISRILKDEEIGHVYYTGELSQDDRHDSVKRFHDEPSIRIMIAGLKCGGLGLNLTCACRVISLDLWWNHTVEKQAFGRVFRIGQTKKTTFLRLAVRNTIDDRLHALQVAKLRIIDKAMWDGDVPPEHLSITELASLFGHVEVDDDGKKHIYADFDEYEATNAENGAQQPAEEQPVVENNESGGSGD